MRKLLLFMMVAAAAVVAVVTGCDRRASYHRMEGSAWNTLYHIIYESNRDLDDSVRDILRQVERSLSPFVDSSAISLINRGESMATDTLIRRVFAGAIEVNRVSGGMFDPTVAPLVNLWGFGYKNSGTAPSDSAVSATLAAVGIDKCYIGADGIMVKKTPATEFNFSAITKGMGCDLVAEMLARNGCDNYMVEIGGEIAMHGVNPRGEAWHIQIDKPIMNDTSIVDIPMAVIAPGDCGIATSGNYRNFKRDSIGRPAFGHTISPRTGRPVMSRVASATVIAPDCMTADALATACMAMEPDSALAMIERRKGTSALLIYLDGDSLTPRATAGFPAFIAR